MNSLKIFLFWETFQKFHTNDSKHVDAQSLYKLQVYIWIMESCRLEGTSRKPPPTSSSQHVQWDQASCALLQLSFEYLWEWKLHNLPGQTCSGVSLHSWGKSSSLCSVRIYHIPTCAPCVSSYPYNMCKLNIKKFILMYWHENLSWLLKILHDDIDF